MTVNKFPKLSISVCVLFFALLSACGSNKPRGGSATLADIDVSREYKRESDDKIEDKSDEEIRKAYRAYVESASSNDSSRQKALTRLAQLELELSNSLTKDEEAEKIATQAVDLSLNRTITLLETTLNDYPDANDNDKVLYQLAQAYDRAGRYNDSLNKLNKLVENYQTSLYYPEAHFRIAEAAFARGDYITAEDSYTEVILTPGSDKFYEKSIFKRGWTRYKQQLYLEALDDYVDAINYHKFEPYHTLSDSDKTQFDEYFRAVGLAFSYQHGQLSIKEYFQERGKFEYLYHTYAVVSDIFLQQERYFDAASVLEEYAREHQDDENTPLAELKVIAAWQEGGFTSRVYEAIERFYVRYNPSASFWQKINNEVIAKESHDALRKYITQVSSYFHARYQSKKKREDYRQTKSWYTRYLKHYKSYANQDNIYTLFAELLLSGNEKQSALEYFSAAAFDGNIILDRKAAYSSIVLADEVGNASRSTETKKTLLERYLSYSQLYVELYPGDSRSAEIAASAAEKAFNTQQYERTITISNLISDKVNDKTRFDINNLKARAFLELEQYADAESVYSELLTSRFTNKKSANTIRSSLALSIYRQAEAAKKEQDLDLALSNFTRIVKVAPQSQLASNGLYDAIAMAIEFESWNQSIGLIEEFKRRYPKHKLIADVTKKLSFVYLKADLKGKAAQEFERIAQFEDNLEVKRAALWQAAELYESKKNYQDAIRAYRDYAHGYKKPFAQNIEAMYKLTQLYQQVGDRQKRYFWQSRIRRAEQNTTKSYKTDRTTFIASTTTLDLARQKKAEFNRYKLVEPLARNLKLKKAAMQEAVTLFGQASAYGVQEITTEATNAIGNIYFQLSDDLLNSERPKNLNSEELEQYEILLEDQAFPFEEKAIEFYEANLTRTQAGIYDGWMDRSFAKLLELFPVRYQREGKVDVYEE